VYKNKKKKLISNSYFVPTQQAELLLSIYAARSKLKTGMAYFHSFLVFP